MTEGTRESARIYERIAKGGLAVAVAGIIVKFAGFAWKWLLIRFHGQDVAVTDAYLFAFEGVVLTFFFLSNKILCPPFLPLFLEEKNLRGERSAWRFASAVATWVFLISALIGVLIVAFPGAWAGFSSWLSGREVPRESGELLRVAVTWVGLALICLMLSWVTYMILNGYKRFFWPQVSDAAMRFFMIGAIVLSGTLVVAPSNATKMLALGIILGAAARLLVHLLAMGKKAVRLLPPRLGEKRTLGMLLLLASPAMIGAPVARLRDLVNNHVLLFPLEKGLLTANSLGRTIFSTAEWLVPFSLSVAMFPYFCDLVDRNDFKKLGEILTRSGRVLMLFFSIFAGSVAILSLPISYLFFGTTGMLAGGRLELVALANTCYVIVLPAHVLEYLLMQAYFSNRRMVMPQVFGVVFSFLSVGISVVAIRAVGLEGAGAIAAIALGYTASRWFKSFFLIFYLKRFVPMFRATETSLFLFKTAVVTAAACGMAVVVRVVAEGVSPIRMSLEGGAASILLRSAAEVAAGAILSCGVALALIKLLGMEELSWLVGWVKGKLASRRGGG